MSDFRRVESDPDRDIIDTDIINRDENNAILAELPHTNVRKWGMRVIRVTTREGVKGCQTASWWQRHVEDRWLF